MGRGIEVKELRKKMGMNRREFCDYFGIPYRTVQDWEAEKRELPDYVLRLMWYRAEIEKKIDLTEKTVNAKSQIVTSRERNLYDIE